MSNWHWYGLCRQAGMMKAGQAGDYSVYRDMRDRLQRSARELTTPMPPPAVDDTGTPGYAIPAAAAAGGTALTAGSLGSRELFKRYLLPASGRYSDINKLLSNADKFVLSSLASDEAFPYLYAERGHHTIKGSPMQVPAVSGMTYVTPGEAAYSARSKLLEDIRESKYLPKFLRNMVPRLPVAAPADTLAHYGAFAHSPLEAYMKMVEEAATTTPTGQFKLNDLRRTIAEIAADTPIETWNDEFSRRLMSSSPYVTARRRIVEGQAAARAPNVRPFMEQVLASADIPLAHKLNAAQIFNQLRAKGLFAEIDPNATPTDVLRAHFDRTFGHLGRPPTLAEVRHYQHPIQKLIDPVLAANFRHATRSYGRYGTAVRGLHGLGSLPVAAIGAGTALAGTAAMLYRRIIDNRSQQKSAQARDYSDRDTVLRDALLGSSALSMVPAGLYGKSQLERYGLKGLNPLSAGSVAVLGGVKDRYGMVPGMPADSFTSQATALAKALQEEGLDVSHMRAHTAAPSGSPYRIANPAAMEDILSRVNAVVQVGAHPAEYQLASSELDPRGILRYRALTDIGEGNFRQPTDWLGSRNWMKVHDAPSEYTRFIVPGGTKYPEIGQLGQRPNINVAGMPVHEMFAKGRFAVPEISAANPARAFVTVGGGAGGFMMFDDVRDALRSAAGTDYYDYARRNVFDDMAEALQKKHGPDSRLTVLMGDIGENKGLRELQQKIMEDTSGRWKNVDWIWGGIPQEKLKDFYAKSHYTFGLPGSTSSEYMAMSGRPGRFISLVPNEGHPWMPKHYSINADYLEKMLPGASTLNFTANPETRVADIVERMSKEMPADLEGRVGEITNYAQTARTIRKDIAKAKLFRASKMMGILGIPVALAASGVYLHKRNNDNR